MIENAAIARAPGDGRALASHETCNGVPLTRLDHVARPRLIASLERGVQGPLTLVSAPAGTGKTSLVASWAASYRSPLVWITLDDDDAEPAIFWAKLSAGLEGVGVDVASAAFSGMSDMPVSLARSLSNHCGPLVLVIDAGRTTADPARDRALAEVLLGANGVLRLVLIGRADPVFPMEWYRLAGDLTEVRATDLAASAVETRALLRQAGMEVSSGEAEALCARTNGWLIALKFAIMSVSGTDDVSAAIRRLAKTDFDIVTHLFNQVIRALPPEIKDILLRTSVVDLLTPGLVELLVGRPLGDDAIEFLANGNQLIERTFVGAERCYRYQPLFREFLRAQLAFERPELDLELRQTAAEYSATEQPPSAVADDGPTTAADGLVIEPLTPREREVLEHLADMLPTREIALTMFISVNTVRTHIRSILRKLGVSRRHQAVRRAWMLGLLPPRSEALAQ